MNEDIRSYLLQHSSVELDVELTMDDSLLEAGVIDSVGMVDLIAYLEQTYGIRVDEDDMTPENFDTVNAIVAFVKSARSG